ncbi:hypothetical protein [Pseudomonas sp. SDO52101_S400]
MPSQVKKTWNTLTVPEVVVAQSNVTDAQPPVAPVHAQRHEVVLKGRLARQRRFEVEALFNRLKETERRVKLLEKTLQEIRPHFFDDHPVSKKIESVLD